MKVSVVIALILSVTCPFLASGEEIKPGILRTPDARFENLLGYDFDPHYIEVGEYRVHYLDEGPADGEIILLLHGEPTWSYLYRKVIPVLTEAGFRSIVPDLIGFGKSDKPVSMDTHTYEFHVNAMATLVRELGLTNITFFGQDWGGLIGLRVVAENESLFARVVISNTYLPIGTEGTGVSPGFMEWKRMNQGMINRGDIPTGQMLVSQTGDPSIEAAYDAPFPDPNYKAGALIMPQRVPVTPDDPAVKAQEEAWEVYYQWEKPFLTAFSDGDRILGHLFKKFQEDVPGAAGQAHTTIIGAGHFLQEQKGEELAQVIVKFIVENPMDSQIAEKTTNESKVSFLDLTDEQVKIFQELDIEGPVLMLNMLRFKKDGGREKYREYSRHVDPLLTKAGGKLVSRLSARATLVGEEEWDEILVVEYPSRKAFLNMVQSDEYKVPKQIRNEALEDSRLISMQAPKR